MEVVNNFRQMNSYRFESLFIFVIVNASQMDRVNLLITKIAGFGNKTHERFGDAFVSGFLILKKFHFYIGFLLQFFPSLILSRVTQNKGKQQSNLFLVSAGSDLRMSPLRPNPLSIRVDERRSKNVRDFLQLFSRTN